MASCRSPLSRRGVASPHALAVHGEREREECRSLRAGRELERLTRARQSRRASASARNDLAGCTFQGRCQFDGFRLVAAFSTAALISASNPW